MTQLYANVVKVQQLGLVGAIFKSRSFVKVCENRLRCCSRSEDCSYKIKIAPTGNKLRDCTVYIVGAIFHVRIICLVGAIFKSRRFVKVCEGL